MLENYLTLRNESAMPSSENFISRNYAPGWELSAYNTLGIFGGFASGFSFQFLGTIPSFLLAVTPNLVSMISDDDTVKGVIKSDGGSMIFNALLVTGATAARLIRHDSDSSRWDRQGVGGCDTQPSPLIFGPSEVPAHIVNS